MTYCPHTIKDAAVELLAKHRAARADKPKDAFKKIEPAKKVDRDPFRPKIPVWPQWLAWKESLMGKL
jgi:hypothetical protein